MARNQLEGFPFHTSQMDISKSKVQQNGALVDLDEALANATGSVSPIYVEPDGFGDGAVTAANTEASTFDGVVRFPPGTWTYTYSVPPTDIRWRHEGMINRAKLGGTAAVNFRAATLVNLAGSHPTTRTSAEALVVKCTGSGANSVAYADVAHEVDITKANWFDTSLAQAGEIDGQIIQVRGGGPTTGTKSAVGGQVIGVYSTWGTGWCGGYEHLTAVYETGGSTLAYSIDIQSGVVNSRSGEEGAYGIIYNMEAGSMAGTIDSTAIRIQSAVSSAWTYILENVKSGLRNFWIDVDGVFTWTLGSSATKFTLRNNSGQVLLRDGDGDTLFAIDQDGPLTLRSNQAAVTLRNVTVGAGSPNAVEDGSIADLFIRTDAVHGKGLYTKKTSTGNSDWMQIAVINQGSTANRPTGLNNASDRGYPFFDLTLVKPIWWTGSTWVDATGASV